MSLLGVDLGTSGVRVVAVTGDGVELAGATRATALSRPAPGRVETDADEVLAAVVALLGEVATHPAVVADPPEALSFSVQGEAVLPVDAAGNALAPAPVSMDRRGVGLAARVAAEVGAAELQRITGQPPHPMFSVYKLAEFEGAAGFRCLGDFVAARLGARPAMDTTMAARTGAYDVDSGQWSSAILESAGVKAELLPEVVPAGTMIGRLDRVIPGLPIVVGTHDQASSFLGGGGRFGETSVFSFGSSDCLTVGTGQRPAGLGGTGLATYPLGRGLWLTLAGTAAGGWALDWLAALTGVTDHDVLFDAVADTPPDVLVLPYLAGSGTIDNDPAARGAIAGLTLETTRDQLARAFLESSAFELRKIADALTGLGVTVGAINAVGGGSLHRRGLGIRAEAADRPLTAISGHAAARGAALQAGVGVGLFPSLAGLPAPAARFTAEPDPATRTWYVAQSRRYRELYPSLIPHDRSYLKEQR